MKWLGKYAPVLLIIFFMLGLFSYIDSIKIIKGDYLFSRWMVTVETNKNWFMLFFWLIVGGTIPYLLVRLTKLYRNRNRKNVNS